MHFGFALELSDIDLWNTDLLDTHLGLLNPKISIQISPVSVLFLSIKYLRGLQDMYSRHLQDQQMFAGYYFALSKIWLKYQKKYT